MSSNITSANIDQLISNFKIDGSPANPGDPQTFSPGGMGNSNPGLPGDLYGIKIEPFGSGGNYSISFDSLRAPMWGDFYSKDGKSGGQDVYVYNTGFGTTPTPDFLNWIPVPDTHEVNVPEPSTYAILAACLALGLLKTRRKVQEAA